MQTVNLNVVFTGICSYEPREVNEAGNRANEVRFVMPNAGKWKRAENDRSFLIPPHHPFLIVRESEVARRPNRKWIGRKPSGRLLDRWVYWMFRDETLRIVEPGVERRNTHDVRLGNTKDVVKLFELCGVDGTMEARCSEGRSGRVAARFVFVRGRLSQRGLTTETFSFRTCNGVWTQPSELADEVQMSLRNVPLTDDEVIIRVRRLDDEDDDDDEVTPRRREQIVLRPTRGILDIYAGSAPEADLAAVVGGAPNHDHGNSNLHFEYHYEVARNREGLRRLPVPNRVDAAITGPIGGTDRCPPADGSRPPGA